MYEPHKDNWVHVTTEHRVTKRHEHYIKINDECFFPSGYTSVRSIPALPGGRQVRSGALGPFPRALGVVGFLRVRLVHSRASLGGRVSSGAFTG